MTGVERQAPHDLVSWDLKVLNTGKQRIESSCLRVEVGGRWGVEETGTTCWQNVYRCFMRLRDYTQEYIALHGDYNK